MTLNEIQESLSTTSLYVKSSVWCADVLEYTGNLGNTDYSNIILLPKHYPEYQSIDFLGSDIDLGFRISKHVTKSRIIVSVELAYILCRIEKPSNYTSIISNQMRIVGYENLKGIWDNKSYPVIWFCKDWNNISFNYDEHIYSPIIKNIKYKRIENMTVLDQILQELDKLKRCDELYNIFKSTLETKQETKNKLVQQVEFHVVAIVINTDLKKIFMVQRYNRHYLNNIWEFGCAQLISNKTFKEVIKDTYKNEFNIDIDAIEEENIVGPYLVDKGVEGIHQGLLFLATTSTKTEIKLNKTKHSNFKWVSLDDISTIDDKDLVLDAKKNIEKAFKIYNKKEQF